MLRAVLADDETKVIYLLEKLIDWEKMGFEITGVASDGLQALQLVEETQPHLLVTDIRMPGCSGLELVKRAKALQPGLHCIIISGYREFEYAQSAIKYGVEDYLLKPLKKDELTAILMRLRDKLGEEERIEYRQEKDRVKRQELLIEALYKSAGQKIPFAGREQVNEEYGFHYSEGICCAAIVRPDVSEADRHREAYRILMQHALDIVRRELRNIGSEAAVSVLREGIAAVIGVNSYDPVEMRQCFTKIRKEIEKQRDLFWDIRVFVSVGSRGESMQMLSRSLSEALWLSADRICSDAAVRDAETETIPLENHYQMDVAMRKRFRDAAELLDEAQFRRVLKESGEELRGRGGLHGMMVREWFYEVVRACIYGMEQSGTVESSCEAELMDSFWYCRSLDEIYALLERKILEKLTHMREERSLQENRPIAQAKEYILAHYSEALRLEDVSAAAGFNATYFSTFFKKETGLSFTDYLGQVRITKAKELLLRDEFSVMDVCEAVGYKDLKYFSRLFKKVTGISPSDYRKLYR